VSGGGAVADAVRRAAAALNEDAMAVLAAFAPAAARSAIDVEITHQQGRAVGLVDAETDEVIDVWNRWYQSRPEPLSWVMVRAAVAARTAGGDWRPAVVPSWSTLDRFEITGYLPDARRVWPFYWRALIGTRWWSVGLAGERGGTRMADVGWAFTQGGAIAVARRRMAGLGMPEWRPPWFKPAEP
jgi:hypothetical protein